MAISEAAMDVMLEYATKKGSMNLPGSVQTWTHRLRSIVTLSCRTQVNLLSHHTLILGVNPMTEGRESLFCVGSPPQGLCLRSERHNCRRPMPPKRVLAREFFFQPSRQKGCCCMRYESGERRVNHGPRGYSTYCESPRSRSHVRDSC